MRESSPDMTGERKMS